MKSLELFAGAGGLGLGITRAGFQPVTVIEKDHWCCDTLRENQSRGIPGLRRWPIVEGDVREVMFSQFKNLDLVSGGPPCQPFSLGGRHQAYDDARDMWPEAVRAIRETAPRAFIFENVKGLNRASFASYLSYIVHQLSYPTVTKRRSEGWIDHLARLEKHHTSGKFSELHYQVVYRVLNAADYGVPQKRERIIFVGFRSDLGVRWSFPDATHSFDALAWSQVISNEYWEEHKVSKARRISSDKLRKRASVLKEKPLLLPWRTTRDAIGDLPNPEKRFAGAALPNHNFQAGARAYTGHTGSLLDEPAKTLKAGVHGVPGGENMLLKPDGTVRYFTVRESARLQTFPDEFVFHGSWSETMRQLGNAVPVYLAEIIAKNVRKHLDIDIKGRAHH